MTSPLTLTVLQALNGAELIGPLTEGGSPVITQAIGDARYLSLAGGTLTGALLGTAASFSGLLTTNGQVAFPATQNPSTNANTLDDYEEGTWTPTMTVAGSAAGIAYSSRPGSYIKIGGQVTIWTFVVLTSKGAGSGAVAFINLPFTPSGAPGGFYGATVSFIGAVTGAPISAAITGSSINIYSGQNTALQSAALANNSQIMITATYGVL